MMRIAKADIRAFGHEFFLKFAASCKEACELRSRWPAGYWTLGGKVGYYSVWEHIGPHVTSSEDLRLLKLWVNKCPVPSVLYKIRGISPNESLQFCDGPRLELCCIPEELSLFGSWLYTWLLAHNMPGALPPKPPVPFGDDGAHKPATAWAQSDSTWCRYDYIWTAAAVAEGVHMRRKGFG